VEARAANTTAVGRIDAPAGADFPSAPVSARSTACGTTRAGAAISAPRACALRQRVDEGLARAAFAEAP